jgi:hypothetical protein
MKFLERFNNFFRLEKPKPKDVKEFSTAVNAYGNWGLIDGTRPDPTRPWEPLQAWDFIAGVSTYDFVQIRSQARKLFANLGPARAAVLQRTAYSFGRAWAPKFTGADSGWGKATTELLNELYYPLADVRGTDFVTALQLDSFCVDVDGDVLIVFTEDDDGYPQLVRVRAHRINSGDSQEDLVEGGDYAGATLYNGVIRNRDGRPIAYRVESGGEIKGESPTFDDISVADCMLISDPEFPDQPRGLPAFTHALQDLLDLKHTVGFQKQSTMLASSIGLLETNESGAPTNLASLMQQAQPGNASPFPIPSGVTSKEFLGGLVKYFRAGTGGKVEVMYNRNPHENWERFMERLERQCCMGIPWPYGMAIDPEGLGGANLRLVLGQAMRSCSDRQDLFRPVWTRMIRYGVAKFIKLGLIPENADWMKWEPTLPPRLSVDGGRERTADQNDYRLGIRNLTDILEEQGLDTEAQLYARATEVAQRKKIAAEVGAAYGVEITDSDMCLLTPNGNPADNPGDAEDTAPPTKAPAPAPPRVISG